MSLLPPLGLFVAIFGMVHTRDMDQPWFFLATWIEWALVYFYYHQTTRLWREP